MYLSIDEKKSCPRLFRDSGFYEGSYHCPITLIFE